MSRPSDARESFEDDRRIENPAFGPVEWLRWAWRQLTSMRTALLLLLALAIAAVPGSIIPQQSADPNGVALLRANDPGTAKLLDAVQGFSVYTSFWFSAIYLLLFISLVGCVIPRVRHHLRAVRAAPPRTPSRFSRLPVQASVRMDGDAASAVDAAEEVLRRKGYRTARYGTSVSAERGYLRETGNLLFHSALVGVLIAVFVGGGFTFTAQKVLVTGQSFANGTAAYDSFMPGRFVGDDQLQRYSLRLDRLDVQYQANPLKPGFGAPRDYTASVTTRLPGERAQRHTIRVNEPLDVGGTSVYLLGNGYAPHITVRNADGSVAFSQSVVFQPQGPTLTSLGVVKARRTTGAQVGLQGFLYPWARVVDGTLTSIYPGLEEPLITLDVFKGRFGAEPENVALLNVATLTKVAGRLTDRPSIRLSPKHPTATLPDGLGTVHLDGITRFAAFDVHHDPAQGWVALFVALAVLGLITSLLVPRRRLWVKVTEGDGALTVEYAGLARGDDPGLARAVADLQRDHRAALPAATAPRRETVRS